MKEQRDAMDEKRAKLEEIHGALGKREEELTATQARCDDEAAARLLIAKQLREAIQERDELKEDLDQEKTLKQKLDRQKRDLAEVRGTPWFYKP